MTYQDNEVDFSQGNVHDICVHTKLSPEFIDHHRTQLASYFVPPTLVAESDFGDLGETLEKKLHDLFEQCDGCVGWNTIINAFTYDEVDDLFVSYAPCF